MAKITVTADRGVSAETLAIAVDAVREALRNKPIDSKPTDSAN